MRGLVVSGFTAIGTGTGAMLVLHTEAGLDPAHTVISEYAFQAAWGLCMLLVGTLLAAPRGVPLSVSPGLRGYAAFVAFLLMPLAGLLLARTGIRHAWLVRVLTVVDGGAPVLIAISCAVRMQRIP